MLVPPLAIGIDIGGTNVRAARVTFSGQIEERLAERTATDPAELIGRLVAMIHRLDRPGIATIGVGVPGRVDARRGQVLSGGYVDLSSTSLASELSARTGMQAFIDNDCNMALVAEQLFGAAHGQQNVAMLTIGTGIGGAAILGGEIVRGRQTAGQLGHVTVELNGLTCKCGRSGCVETTSSGTALGRHMAEAGLPAGTTADQLLELRRQGDPRAVQAIDAFARPLRTALDSIAASFDPDLILLGGGLGGAACAALEWAPARSPWYQYPVRAATLGDDAGVIGAALAGALNGAPSGAANGRLVGTPGA